MNRSIAFLALSIATACGGETFTVADSDAGTGAAPNGSGSAGGSATGGSAAGGSSAGGSATGGAVGGGGTASGGAAGGTTSCAKGSLDIKVTASNPASYCADSCGATPITIKTQLGKVIRTTTSCETSCADCGPVICPLAACLAPTPMKEPFLMTWDGSQFPQSTCGAAVTCYETQCTLPGTYVIEACLPKSQPGTTADQMGCDTTGEFDCKQKEIAWPPTGSVVFEF